MYLVVTTNVVSACMCTRASECAREREREGVSARARESDSSSTSVRDRRS